MKYVREILDKKGHDIYSVTPETTVFDALKVLKENNIGAVLVLDDSGLCGIMSERDYAHKVILRGKISKDTLVKEIMVAKILYVTKDEEIENCMALMTDKHIRHLPVYDGDELTGIISIGDVVKGIIDEREFTIDQLERYIKGTV
jgi:CBS domain-containing protein